MARNRRTAKPKDTDIQDYRHDATRKNNPAAGIAARGTINEPPKVEYAYNPHRPPTLRFDGNGDADRIPELLAKAKDKVLSEEEIAILAEALQHHEPWLEWSGKQETQSFAVDPGALHIHERVSAKAIMNIAARENVQRNLFADPQLDYNEAVQFYQHDVAWANRLILGDSLTVMSSLANREDLGGKVQTIYFDPPYGIKFASNFQPNVFQKNVGDKAADLTREPEQIQAYRDTWHLGVHSYLAYLRDRLVVARELLTDSGSIFVQISDENVHRVRCLMDEVFGGENFVRLITYRTAYGKPDNLLQCLFDYIIWYAKDKSSVKYRPLFRERTFAERVSTFGFIEEENNFSRSLRAAEKRGEQALPKGQLFKNADTSRFDEEEIKVLQQANRVSEISKGRTVSKRYESDNLYVKHNSVWTDTVQGTFELAQNPKKYVVQTAPKVIQRCLLMTTDPGELVLDPTCGSGTTAYVAEQWGRRWISIDTSRVAIALARQRILTSSFDYYTLKEPTKGIAVGFVNEIYRHVSLKQIAKNAALDSIFAKHEPILATKLAELNQILAAVGGGSNCETNSSPNWRRKRNAKEKEPSPKQTGGDGFFPKPHGKNGRCRLTQMRHGRPSCALR